MSVRIFTLFTLLSVLLMYGCGGGGGGGGSTGPTSTATLNGTAIKGVVVDGAVTAYAITNGAQGSLLETTTTDANGQYSLTIQNYTGPVFLEIVGGTYIDEATGNSIAMPTTANDGLTAIVSNVSNGQTVAVQITALTTFASQLAAALPGGFTPANIQTANSQISQFFTLTDINSLQPINPLDGSAVIGGNQNAVDYGLILAGISEQAETLGIGDPMELIRALAIDISDGVFDGLQQSNPVFVSASTQLAATAGTADLATAIDNFANDATRNLAAATPSSNLLFGLNNASGSLTQIPDLLGYYLSGPVAVTSSGCMDSADNGVFTFPSGVLTLTSQNGANISATIELQATLQGTAVISTEMLTGTVTSNGILDGSLQDTLKIDNQPVSSGSGSFNGQAAADTITLQLNGQDTSGDTCAWSASVVFTKTTPVKPDTPSGVSATPGDGQVQVSWAPVTDADSYNIYWNTSGGVTSADQVIANVTTNAYTHTGRTNGTTYYYKVTAYRAGVESDLSVQVDATPNVVVVNLPAPGGLDASVDDGQITVRWDPVANATAYTVYMGIVKNIHKGNIGPLGQIFSNATSPYVIPKLENRRPYYIFVTATTAEGESVESVELMATPTRGKWFGRYTTPVQETLFTAVYTNDKILLSDISNLYTYHINEDRWSTKLRRHFYSPANVVNNKIYTVANTYITEYDIALDLSATKMTYADRGAISTVALNDKIYVLGGNDGVDVVNIMEEYNPVTNTLSPMTPMPTPRQYMVTAAVNNKLYAIGGQDLSYNYSAAVEEYDPGLNQWVPKQDRAFTTSATTSTVVGTDIYIFYFQLDGATPNVVDVYHTANDTWASAAVPPRYVRYCVTDAVPLIHCFNTQDGHFIYDPATNQWDDGSITIPGVFPSVVHPSAAVPFQSFAEVNNKLYNLGWDNSSGTQVRKVVEYDPAQDSWTFKAPLPAGFSEEISVAVNDKIYYIGIPGSQVQEYDTVNDIWALKAVVPASGYYSDLTGILERKYGVGINGKVYSVGWGPFLDGIASKVYDPVADAWGDIAPLPDTRWDYTVSAVNGKMYVFGGETNAYTGASTTTVWAYDPVSYLWSSVAPMPSPRIGLTSSVADGKLYLIGGSSLALVDEYDPVADSWSAMTPMPTARDFPVASTANGLIYTFGGYTQPCCDNNTFYGIEIFDPKIQ